MDKFWSIHKLHIIIALRELESQRGINASAELRHEQIRSARALYAVGYLTIKQVPRGLRGQGGGTLATLTTEGRALADSTLSFLEQSERFGKAHTCQRKSSGRPRSGTR